jgi:hypothetical protein
MKIFSCFFLLAFLWQMHLSVKAEETNELYVIDDTAGIMFIGENTAKVHHDELVEQAKKLKTRESLPAKDFPEGNWGEIANGIQLSLRFTKTIYTNGEPIEAIVLLRNVTNQIIKLNFYRDVDLLDGAAVFQIISETGEIIPEHFPSASVVEGGNFATCPPPGTQQRYVEHLNLGYELTNGMYTVCAIVNMAYLPQSVVVKSAPVTIRFLDVCSG